MTTPFISLGRNASETPPVTSTWVRFDDSIKRVHSLDLYHYKRLYNGENVSLKPSVQFPRQSVYMYMLLPWERGQDSNFQTMYE